MNQLLSRKFATPLPLMIVVEIILVSGAEKGCKAPTAFTGSSANITCYFDDNVAQLQMNVFIEHLHFNASDHEIVTSCRMNEGRYNCSCNDGYRVVGTVTDFLTVEIPDALPKHAGQYWCGGFKSQPLERTHCKLSVMEDLNLNGPRPHNMVSLQRTNTNEDINASCTADKIALGGSGNVSCFFSRDLSKTLTDVYVYIYKDDPFDPGLILRYEWTNNTPVHFTESGYTLIDSLTNRLEISIKNATRKHEGTYKCLDSHAKGESSKTCTLVIETEGTNKSETGDVGTTTRITVTTTTIIIVTVVLVVAVVIVIVFIAVAYKKGFLSKWVRNINGSENRRHRIEYHTSDHNAENDLTDETRTIKDKEQSQVFFLQ